MLEHFFASLCLVIIATSQLYVLCKQLRALALCCKRRLQQASGAVAAARAAGRAFLLR